MFSPATSFAFAAAMRLISRMKLMEMPTSVLVGYSVNIMIAIGGLWVTQTILEKMAGRMAPWHGLIRFISDWAAQAYGVLMLVLSNCVVEILTWYSGSLWLDVLQVMVALGVMQTLQYRVPAILTT
jgi:hypothetical protein